MAVRPKLRDATAERLERIKEEHEYGSLDGAINHVLQEREDMVIVAYDGSRPTRAFTTRGKAREWREYWTEHGGGQHYKLVEVQLNDLPEGDGE